MKALRFTIVLAVAALCVASAALADEAIATHTAAPPASAQSAEAKDDPVRAQQQADGDWARGVMARAADGKDAKDPQDEARGGCRPYPSDGKPHGEAWVGVGSRGYNDAGFVVTQPLGECGQATLAVSRTDFGKNVRRGGPRR